MTNFYEAFEGVWSPKPNKVVKILTYILVGAIALAAGAVAGTILTALYLSIIL